jgi:hypothetical protein
MLGNLAMPMTEEQPMQKEVSIYNKWSFNDIESVVASKELGSSDKLIQKVSGSNILHFQLPFA